MFEFERKKICVIGYFVFIFFIFNFITINNSYGIRKLGTKAPETSERDYVGTECEKIVSSSGESDGSLAAVIEGLEFVVKFVPIPGIKQILDIISFTTAVVAESIASDMDFSFEILAIVLDLPGYIFGPISGDMSESGSEGTDFGMIVKLTYQKVKRSNLYCTYNNVYREEKGLVEKAYNIFPIYPLKPIIDENNQCSLGNVAENFVNLKGDAFGSSDRKPNDSKCSYSYSTENSFCVDSFSKIVFPMEVAMITASVFCMLDASSAIGKKSKKNKDLLDSVDEDIKDKALDEARENITDEVKEKVQEGAQEAMDKAADEAKSKVDELAAEAKKKADDLGAGIKKKSEDATKLAKEKADEASAATADLAKKSEAKNLADAAKTKADDAKKKADDVAEAAKKKADDAQAAFDKASEADKPAKQLELDKANKAKVDADQAKVDADQAKVNADQAKVDADQAKVDADQAKVNADQAKVDADQAKAAVDEEKAGSDKIAQELLEKETEEGEAAIKAASDSVLEDALTDATESAAADSIIEGLKDGSIITTKMGGLKKFGKVGSNVLKVSGDIAAIAAVFSGGTTQLSPYDLGQFYFFVANVEMFAILYQSTSIIKIIENLSCFVGWSIFSLTADITINVVVYEDNNYSDALNSLKRTQFCGYNWYSYQKTKDGSYHKKGAFDKSYFKFISSCLNSHEKISKDYCELHLKDFFPDAINIEDTSKYVCDIDEEICKNNKISDSSKYNKVYREFFYGGVERAFALDVDEYEYQSCIDPRLFDDKGFKGIVQRYYMKGNEKANLACERFFYNNTGCILPESKVNDVDKNNLKEYTVSFFSPEFSDGNVKGEKYYLINSEEYINKYSAKCAEVFETARMCCESRKTTAVCIENKTPAEKDDTSLLKGDVENLDIYQYTTCNAQQTSEIVQSKKLNFSESIAYLDSWLGGVKNEEALERFSFPKCFLKINREKRDLFQIEKVEGTEYACAFSYNFCPFNFKLNAGLNYAASYCDSKSLFLSNHDSDPEAVQGDFLRGNFAEANGESCSLGVFNEKNLKLHSDALGADFSIAKDVFNDPNGRIDSSFSQYAFCRVRDDMKNFTKYDHQTINMFQENLDGTLFKANKDKKYRVEYSESGVGTYVLDEQKKLIEDEKGLFKKYSKDGNDVYNLDINGRFKLVGPSSASGNVKNFCQYRAHCVKVEAEDRSSQDDKFSSMFMDASCDFVNTTSRNKTMNNSNFLVPNQFTSRIAECIFESLKNLIQGVAGYSSCAGEYQINKEGYCGTDTKLFIEERIKKEDTKYINDRYNFIRGEPLPLEANPFLKLQNNMSSIFKMFATFAIMFFGFRILIMKDFDILQTEKISGIIFVIFKLALMGWLVLYNGWQTTVYEKVINFSIPGTTFVNGIFLKAINNEHNRILDTSKGELITLSYTDLSEDGSSIKNLDMCYNIDYFDNYEFFIYNKEIGECTDFNGKILNYPRIIPNARIKITDDKNIEFKELYISSNQAIRALVYFKDQLNSKQIHTYIISKYTEDGSFSNDLSNAINPKYDGCYFDPTEYPDDKTYLAMFDIMDCKIFKYLGTDRGENLPTFLMIAIAMALITSLGAPILGFALAIILNLLNLCFRILFIFLYNNFMLLLLIFASPMIFPLSFFKKTKGIFDKWLDMVQESIFKPMFVFVGFFIVLYLYDIVLYNGVSFKGHNSSLMLPSLACGADAKYNILCVMNNMGTLFSSFFSSIGGIFTSGFSNFGDENFPFVYFLMDLFLFYFVMDLANKVLEQTESMVDNLFGSSLKMGVGSSKENGFSKDTGALGKVTQNSATGIQKNSKALALGVARKAGDALGSNEWAKKAGGKLRGGAQSVVGGAKAIANKVGNRTSFETKKVGEKLKNAKDGDNSTALGRAGNYLTGHDNTKPEDKKEDTVATPVDKV